MGHDLQEQASNFEILSQKHDVLALAECEGDSCAKTQIAPSVGQQLGENRDIDVVQQEAEDFLRELHQDNFFADEIEFRERLQHVRTEIQNGSIEGVIWATQEFGTVGGTWTQTVQELEFGIQRAWRNAEKCIMRSHCENISLCDLRSVKYSNEMALELVKGLNDAYNDGNIIPTVFVFPPRTPNKSGPLIWNEQILSFAAYETENGSFMGDPRNAQLTKDIIELGWVPPQPRSPWDILPVVVMAEDDEPVLVELPMNLRKLVEIRHPKYDDAFWRLDLKWVAFPAPSKFGFDIGGIQYTATPFMGWFLDTEIGIHSLANPYRYHVLPEIVNVLYLDNPSSEPANDFKALPKHEQLAMLSRAQTELNYAIYHSFFQDGITISDTLSSSKKWASYNDDFEKKNGYRLSSDTYWLTPSEGPMIPVWQRGSTPTLNHPPKPMICRQAQDPVTVWKNRKSKRIYLDAIRPTRRDNISLSKESLLTTFEGDNSPIMASDDNRVPKISLPSNTIQDNVISFQEGSADPTDRLVLPNHAEPDFLARSWDALAEFTATTESSPSKSVDNFPPSIDVSPLSSSWETILEPITKPELVLSIGANESSLDYWDSSLESAEELDLSPLVYADNISFSSHVELGPPDDWDSTRKPGSRPLIPREKSFISRRLRSNSLSTIAEEEQIDEEEDEGGLGIEENLQDQPEEILENQDKSLIGQEDIQKELRKTYDQQGIHEQEGTQEGIHGIQTEMRGEQSETRHEGEKEKPHRNESSYVETRHFMQSGSDPVISEPTDDPNLPTGYFDFSGESEPIGSPLATIPSNGSVVGSSNSVEKGRMTNTLLPLDVTGGEGALHDPEIVSQDADENNLTTGCKSSFDRPQQSQSPSMMHRVPIQPLRTHLGTLDGSNTFVFEDPIRILSRIFQRVYPHILGPHNFGAGVLLGRHISDSLQRESVSRTLRNTEGNNPTTTGIREGLGLDGESLGTQSRTSTSAFSQWRIHYSIRTNNFTLPTNTTLEFLNNVFRERATKLYYQVKVFAETLHDFILTAHPLNNLQTLLADRSFPAGKMTWKAFQNMLSALYRWARKLPTKGEVTSALRFSPTTIIDELLVCLTRLRTKYEGFR
ncbi:nitric oxide synthase-like protein [Collybia sordida]|uniref:nitric-oxide synthase (NADPH) n=1 Tax=Collybia sordida TaxID=123925 RepID=A0A8H3YIK3_9AGAR|nr:nitric oxide synthase-like protein [Collybia sordida]